MLTCSECLSFKGECDGSCGKTAKRAFSQTNADRIRQMTDEELAQYMGDVQTWGGCPNHGARNCMENCADCWLDWLKQEEEVTE